MNLGIHAQIGQHRDVQGRKWLLPYLETFGILLKKSDLPIVVTNLPSDLVNI
jgi:hypothetical protein